jgi:Tol biopolymer transport system component
MYLGNTGLRNPAVVSVEGRLVGEHWTYDANIWRLSLTETTEPAGPPESLIASTRLDAAPDFSPDGAHVVFVSDRSGSSQVWVSRQDAREPVRLTDLDAAFVGAPRWSPDGRHIVFEAHVDGNADLYLTDVDGNLPRRLTTHPALDVAPRWSRDGQVLYFGSYRSGAWQVWKVGLNDGTLEQVTRSGGVAAEEAIDGVWLYFTKADTNGVWRRPLHGGPEAQVIDAVPAGFARSWALTDDGLVFLHGSREVRQISYYAFATGQKIPLASPRHYGNLTVSPDGRTLLYTQADHVESDIMLVEGVW